MSEYDPEFVKLLLKASKAPPEAKFNNINDLLKWLDGRSTYQRLNFGPDLP